MRLLDDTKRQAILTGALRILDRRGLAGLSMDAVAKAAGVATGTIYLYFENKEALLNALYVDVKAELSRQVFSAASPTAALRPAFEQMCVAYLEYVTAHRADLVFMREFPNSPHLLEESRARTSGTLAPLVELLERAQAEGLLKSLPVPFMVAFLQGTLTEMAAYIGADPEEAQEQRVEVARLCWDALKD
jgi:AcrR family transcriptional regulator